MNTAEIRGVEDAHLARFYARKPLAIVSGKGAVVFDAEGREYVDCAGGYGTCLVGHAHPAVAEAIEQQARKLISCHGSTYNDARARLLSKLVSILPPEHDRVFLSNSGAEAVECAIKVSRKFTGRRKIIAFKNGYHGKTQGALSATWDSKYRKSFEPLVPDFTHITYGNFEAAKEAISNDTAAVLVEPIQGESGIRVPPPDWLPLLRDLTHDTGALLVADEIQTGFGRTGKILLVNISRSDPISSAWRKGLLVACQSGSLHQVRKLCVPWRLESTQAPMAVIRSYAQPRKQQSASSSRSNLSRTRRRSALTSSKNFSRCRMSCGSYERLGG